ncbi:hypothetical protein [Spiroplasma endosymbiont of Tipula paludosa]
MKSFAILFTCTYKYNSAFLIWLINFFSQATCKYRLSLNRCKHQRHIL